MSDNIKIINVNDEDIQIYTTIDDSQIEDNSDMFCKKEYLEDTIELDNVIKEINIGDGNG